MSGYFIGNYNVVFFILIGIIFVLLFIYLVVIIYRKIFFSETKSIVPNIPSSVSY